MIGLAAARLPGYDEIVLLILTQEETMTKSRLFILTVGFAAAAVFILSPACQKKSSTRADSGTTTTDAGTINAPAKTAEEDSASKTISQTEEAKGRGWIEVKGADFLGHEIWNSTTGEKVSVINSLQTTMPLPAGTYDLGFGATIWKGVEVKAGKTTVLEPGGLTLNHAMLNGHDVVSVGPGLVQGTVSATKSHIVLIPGKYAVKFGPLSWTVDVLAGKTTTLDPGIIEIVRADIQGHKIYDPAGAVVGDVNSTRNSLPLPPGDYAVDLDGKRVPFTLHGGKTVKLELKSPA